jgi:GxxExxY protein
MHPKYERAHELSREVIGAGVEVHRILGPGLLESIYEKCLRRELELRGMSVLRQQQVEINYKGFVFSEELRFDLLVEGCLLVEVKAAQEVHPINKAQLLSYMKLLDVPLGLIMNFHEERLVDGVSRMTLRGAGSADLQT